MSAQHTATPWKQGTTLRTTQTESWSPEELALNEAREKRLVFAQFSALDQGRGRRLVAACERAEDAARIVQCVNAHDELRSALLLLLDQVDYTRGACALTEMVGACLDAKVIDKCRAAITTATGSAA